MGNDEFDMGDDALLHCLDRRVDFTISFICPTGLLTSQHLRPRIPRLALPRSSFEARVHLLQLSSRGVSHAANARVYVAISRSKLVRCLSYIPIKMVVPHHARSFYFPVIRDSLDPLTGAGRHRIRSSRAVAVS